MQFKKREFEFLLICNILSLLQGLFYLWYGFRLGFSIYVYLMAGFDFLFLPISFIFRRIGFVYYLFFDSIIVLICTAFNQTELLNNFSALLCIFVAILLQPERKRLLMGFYLVLEVIMFIINDEPVYFCFIHTVRAIFIFVIYDFVIYGYYNRKPFILYDDERFILEQMTDNKLQKEIELYGLSDRTIRRRLDAARKRNKVKTNEELKELYIKHYKHQ